MSRPFKSFQGFGVFSPAGRLETAKHTEGEAEDAARVIGGTNWRTDGYTVEPVTVIRLNNNSSHRNTTA